MEFKTGLGRHEITCFIPGIGMMGYGKPENVVKDVMTDLHARALVLKDSRDTTLILIHLDLAFASQSIKESLLAKIQEQFPELDATESSLLVTATHTHSAPGGFSHYPLYNFTIPGHQKEVLRTICDGSMRALKAALASLEEVSLSFGTVTIDAAKEVAFNRSIAAWKNNPEATTTQKHLAVDRRMRGLLLRNKLGRLKGFLNWFGVHATSVSSDNHSIHHDNKGVAASLFEKNHPGTMAFFLQSAAGDISPNFIWDKRIRRMRGKFKDQYENAAFNGELQFREAEKIIGNVEIHGPLRAHHRFVNMSEKAAPPAHGIAFCRGTLEGPGVPAPVIPFMNLLAKGISTFKKNHDPRFYKEHAPKQILLDHRDGSFLGIPLQVWKLLPPLPDKSTEYFRQAVCSNSLKTLPWVPFIVPFQLVQIGPILLATIPGEITTMAARRLEHQLLAHSASLGVTEVIITSYANSYMGYVTTPEEYDIQCYEGGHTIYGRNTLRAILTTFDTLLSEFSHESTEHEVSARPFHYPADELARRSF